MRKKAFTLIELLTALALLAILLTTLFGWYRHLTLGKKKTSQMVAIAQERRYCDIQLQKILTRTDLKPVFYTAEDGLSSLVFTFDNGVQKKPALSGSVLARLYLDPKRRALCLGIWPKNGEEKPHQTRILLENVERLRFFFYWPPDPFGLAVDPAKVGKPTPYVGWTEKPWLKEYGELPPMMKVELTYSPTKKEEFLYELPASSKSRILYRKES